MKIEAARLLTYRAAWLYDQGKADPVATSTAKAFASRIAMEVTDEAIQIHGGYGYLAECYIECYHRCAKITEIYDGTTDIQKLTITSSEKNLIFLFPFFYFILSELGSHNTNEKIGGAKLFRKSK